MSSTATVSIEGMTCGSCVAAITSALTSMPGLGEAAVSLVTERAAISFDDSIVTIEEIVERIEDCGFDAKLLDVQSNNNNNNNNNNNDSDKALNNPNNKSRILEVKIKIYGMTCSSCTGTVESQLRSLDGVNEVSVALATEEARIIYDSALIGPRQLIETIEDSGFDAILSKLVDNAAQVDSLSRVKEIRLWKKRLWTCLVFGIPVMIITMVIPMFIPSLAAYFIALTPGLYIDGIVCLLLTTPVQFGIGAPFYRAAYKSLKHKSATMDVLVCLSTSCAYFYSVFIMLYGLLTSSEHKATLLFDASVMLFTFIILGKYLENRAKGATSMALSRLISLNPPQADIYINPKLYVPLEGRNNDNNASDFQEKTIPSELLQVGDIVILRPGSKVPADGIVVSGTSYVDEAHITGESVPVAKTIGSPIFGGSVNGSGRMDFQVQRAGSDTTLFHIVKLVEDAQMARAPIERYVDYVSGYFVIWVVILSLITLIGWLVLSKVLSNPPELFKSTEGPFMVCLRLCISVIVVACPCALGLATPTAVMVGTGVGAQNGILIKGGPVLEMASIIKRVVFDKTGTLTTGKMSVVNKSLEDGIAPDLAWRLMGALEEACEHPIGRAVATEAKVQLDMEEDDSLLSGVSLDNFETIVGEGVRGLITVQNQSYTVIGGSVKLLERYSVHHPEILNHESGDQGTTLTHFAVDGHYIATLGLFDTIKPDAKHTVQILKRMGLAVGMITGDNLSAAHRVADQVGISREDVYGHISPEGKLDLINSLQGKVDTVTGKELAWSDSRVTPTIMVGDGINDSPALVAAALGIALSSGTDVAMEAADIVLLRENTLMDVPASLDLARATFRRIKINLIWACVYNTIMIPFAMGFFLPWGYTLDPMLAGAAMAFSSVSVVTSSLMLRWWKRPAWHSSVSADGFEYDHDMDVERNEVILRDPWYRRWFKKGNEQAYTSLSSH